MSEDKKPSGVKSRLKRILETVKSALLTLLFISMTALVCVYIVRTQRMTLESADNIDIGRMLTLRSGDDSFISGFSAERVLPECVAVKIGGEGRAIMGGRGILAGALSLLSDPLSAILSDAVPVTGIPEEDVDAVWLACCSAKDSVYIRFRSPLPAPVLLLYISGGGEAEGELTSASACYIEELFILPTEASDYGSGIRGCRAVARDGYGNTFRIDGEGMTVDLPAIASYSTNSEFSGFVFAGDVESPSVLPELDLEDSAVVTRGESPQLCTVFTYDAAGSIKRSPEPILTLFGYNMSRISKYEDPDDGSVIYIETWGNLRISDDGVDFTSTGQRGGIDVSRWLPYGRAGGSYSIYELLHCAENFISGLAAVDPRLTGGDAQLYLRDIFINPEGDITLSYRFIFDGINVICGGRGIDISFGGGMIRNVSVKPLTAENQLTRLMNLSMARCFEGRAGSASSGSGRVSLIYPAGSAGPDEQISARWAFVTRSGGESDLTVETILDTLVPADSGESGGGS